jgi:hypothetical protein
MQWANLNKDFHVFHDFSIGHEAIMSQVNHSVFVSFYLAHDGFSL